MRITKRIEEHVRQTVREAYAERYAMAGKEYRDKCKAANDMIAAEVAALEATIQRRLADEFPGFTTRYRDYLLSANDVSLKKEADIAQEARRAVEVEIGEKIDYILLQLELCQSKELAETLERLFAAL